MLITERELRIDLPNNPDYIFPHLEREVRYNLTTDETPVRFVVTKMNEEGIYCEIGVIDYDSPNHYNAYLNSIDSIFKIQKRTYENTNNFNIALIIPTGIGCELGGHSGDGGAVARLFASVCDQLITHPNVVNAADINELPENGLYVEGSILSRLLMGTITLQKVRSNRVLLIIDKHEESFHELAINSASAARAALGLNCPLVVIMDKPILMSAEFTASGRAAGRIERFDNICNVLEKYREEYDAVALSTLIEVPDNYHADYFKEDEEMMVNPWGGVEAMLTHSVSSIYDVPSAHSPMMTSHDVMNLDVGIVDPRKAAEAVSMTFLHCILKGLYNAPRILSGIHSGNGLICNRDISCIVIPDGCIGLPVFAAIENDIPVIAVKDRHANVKNSLQELPFKKDKLFLANNYLEAAGIVSSLKAGVSFDSIKRPMDRTKLIHEE